MMYRTLNKILIANRGEIALRIVRAVQSLGKEAMVIYSSFDAGLPYVQAADKALLIEGETLTETYLNVNKIIDLAIEAGADAIHPGYGFLSENSDFPRACSRHNIVFIGPGDALIERMGNKSLAREIAQDAGLPVLPSLRGSHEEILANASELTFPVIIKPVAGGGGKGMHIVYQASELGASLQEAARLALSVFGNDELYVENYMDAPRHIEVQVLADAHGNCLHLYDRECSVQRRFQKIIEEAPSVSISEETREKITASALDLCRKIGYLNAGTVEFLLDQEENFYFMEMNTRIQVEHPVTEMITGIDIVKQQIWIAENKELTFTQSDISIRGHAIELRLYAEDPENDFMPSSGTLRTFDYTKLDIRIDSAYTATCEIGSLYDPMLAKLISAGKDRNEAAKTLSESIVNLHVTGIETNKNFLKQILDSSDFLENRIHTNYIEQSFLSDELGPVFPHNKKAAIMAAILLHHKYTPESEQNIWNELGFWRFQPVIHLEIGQKKYHLIIEENRQYKGFVFLLEGNSIHLKILKQKDGYFTCQVDNEKIELWAEIHGSEITLDLENETCKARRLDILDGRYIPRLGEEEESSEENMIRSPLNGRVVKIFAEHSQPVKKGDKMVVIESMKMENVVLSPRDAYIEAINVEINEIVKSKKVLITFKD